MAKRHRIDGTQHLLTGSSSSLVSPLRLSTPSDRSRLSILNIPAAVLSMCMSWLCQSDFAVARTCRRFHAAYRMPSSAPIDFCLHTHRQSEALLKLERITNRCRSIHIPRADYIHESTWIKLTNILNVVSLEENRTSIQKSVQRLSIHVKFYDVYLIHKDLLPLLRTVMAHVVSLEAHALNHSHQASLFLRAANLTRLHITQPRNIGSALILEFDKSCPNITDLHCFISSSELDALGNVAPRLHTLSLCTSGVYNHESVERFARRLTACVTLRLAGSMNWMYCYAPVVRHADIFQMNRYPQINYHNTIVSSTLSLLVVRSTRIRQELLDYICGNFSAHPTMLHKLEFHQCEVVRGLNWKPLTLLTALKSVQLGLLAESRGRYINHTIERHFYAVGHSLHVDVVTDVVTGVVTDEHRPFA